MTQSRPSLGAWRKGAAVAPLPPRCPPPTCSAEPPFPSGTPGRVIAQASTSCAIYLKLQDFGHLMGRADSLEKTLMLGKIEWCHRYPHIWESHLFYSHESPGRNQMRVF